MSKQNHDALAKTQVESIGIPDGEPSFLSDPVQDSLLEAAIALGGELWVERERRARLESLLISKGVLSKEEIEACVLTDEETAGQNDELIALVNRLFGSLTTLPGDR